ncbi:holo-ACP synthase [Planomicrobium sp. YIM 101495]|uniref:holo-ACP synthase n=1 Tax=Planomicrobium sp. YIM 101495 TaxID=2665160 RepID=UPI0012B96AC7|nr:holo-ACP synthase [Planomicrobium sp. YIM 101495]MTD31583.1 holo-[acyl-carrier-protein] synthase [Planomicrobium sp. YIM 101495]
MITGIGLDMIELDRIRRLDERSPKFRTRVLTPAELVDYNGLAGRRRTEFLAGRFAAKEAFAKAMGTGIGVHCSFQSIQVLRGENGRPRIYFNEQERGFVSITHTKGFAAAQVVLET